MSLDSIYYEMEPIPKWSSENSLSWALGTQLWSVPLICEDYSVAGSDTGRALEAWFQTTLEGREELRRLRSITAPFQPAWARELLSCFFLLESALWDWGPEPPGPQRVVEASGRMLGGPASGYASARPRQRGACRISQALAGHTQQAARGAFTSWAHIFHL